MRRVAGFLSKAEQQQLAALASSSSSSFVPGRQNTGYEKLPLRDRVELEPLLRRARALLAIDDDNELWDAWLLRYPTGSGVPAHVDAADGDFAHVRVNAIVRGANSGGVFAIDGVVIDLDVGDGVVFRPDVDVHEVSVVGAGDRVVFSVGAWVKS